MYEYKKLKRNDLVEPELSFKVVGILYEAHNELGYGFAESVYQRAVAAGLKKAGVKFQEQVYAPVVYQGQKISSGYLDFVIEGKLVLEIKKGDRFAKFHIEQVHQYLLSKKLKLGILAYFGPKKLHFKRIVNLKDS